VYVPEGGSAEPHSGVRVGVRRDRRLARRIQARQKGPTTRKKPEVDVVDPTDALS
jgi:hypothetical protein